MATSPQHETAKIFQFPIKTRTVPAAGQRDQVNLDPDIGPRIATAAFDSWYHEAAITESDQTRKQ
ncbi:DUF2735 domain-containing protein [Rhizobium sp. LEGMi198b]|uniref:DUF2735 domain-containing protein n=1 Tax=unclassified Rhizobium TaxID=2613769 RepID=UPI000CDF3F36|nr:MULTISPECIES: DUF2735 domain-containing protein [Rhizobium]AVA20259.1 glutamine synthetase translation inhibitor [Rhizobium sp. NXC24]MDK4740622.1 DUF2735 domain-containing protein [Rhizobium sp. CNPSo 3464]UWU21551.1 DUF2735 domain-containing protein [Rhizobium tropici]WFU02369.1 DUF2735 domain-containing protein [Rhizobium sp. CB3171]